MEYKKVTVKIFGQEYTISGDKSEEHIQKVADLVNEKMVEIATSLGYKQNSLVPVLASVNFADDYLSAMERFEYLEVNNQKNQDEINHYVELWEEAKENHINYQEDLKKLKEEKELLQKSLDEKEQELYNLKESIKTSENEINRESSEELVQLQVKYKDLESSFFDIQMENIQLKGEIDRYKKKMV